MPATLTIRDESITPGSGDHAFALEVPSESMTVRELIRERVYQEVHDQNRAMRAAIGFCWRRQDGDGQPDTEIDWRAAFERAIDAYERRQIHVLVGDRQTESLDERIDVSPSAEVVFLRTVLLAGG